MADPIMGTPQAESVWFEAAVETDGDEVCHICGRAYLHMGWHMNNWWCWTCLSEYVDKARGEDS